MDVTKEITDKDGNQRKVKVQMPSAAQILNAINQRGMFNSFTRYKYDYDAEDGLKLIEAIGKSRDPKFVIDEENRFAYLNLVKWCHGDNTIEALNPYTREVIPGRLRRGIYIAGNTGSGKSWCLEIIQAYASAFGFRIQFIDDNSPRPLWWRICRADGICDVFTETGSIQEFKKQPMLGIQDLGNEPPESLYMGNRVDVMRQLIEYRGDKSDELTFITSNLKINGEKLIDRYGDRVASRLCEMCNYYEIKGKDRRKL